MPTNCKFACTACGTLTSDALAWQCADCGAPLTAEPARIKGRDDIDTDVRSLWRYRAWLACSPSAVVTLGEGWTPLVEQEFDGRRIHWKCDFISPSGSFKDRGVSVMVNHLIGNAVTSVAEDSSGNGGASLATYAAAARLRCRIYVPAAASAGKVAQITATGAAVERISGSRDAVTQAAMQDETGAYYASHNRHPMFAEGMKTAGYEIWEQLAFETPDIIVVPAGGGSNVIGCYRAFSELCASGLVARLPKIIGVQSAACDPLARAAAAENDTLPAVSPEPTIAEGIALAAPIRGREALAAARATGGTIISVSETDILAAYFDLAGRGFYVEPTSATAAAGLRALSETDWIALARTIVVILTGSGLKTGAISGDSIRTKT